MNAPPAATPEPSPRRRRARQRTTPLTRVDVVAAAFEIAQRDGLEQLTMRSLADALGVTVMALYAHVADKDDILDAIIDDRLRQLGILPFDVPWRDWLTDAAQRLRRLLADHPALLDRYRRRPVGVPAALERMEAVLHVLHMAGFTDRDAIDAYATIHTYIIGFAALEAARAVSDPRPRRIPSLDATSPGFWPAYLATLDPDRFPHLTTMRPDLAAVTQTPQFDTGLRILLDGITRTLEQHPPVPQSPKASRPTKHETRRTP